MKTISNRNFQLLVEKLPSLFAVMPSSGLSLHQQEDIRQLKLVHRQLTRKNSKNNKTNNPKTRTK